MKRREFIKSSALLAGSCIFGTAFGASKEIDAKKPNVIYILADDAGYADISCYGQKLFSTPNIDSMAASGIKFTDHYAGCTVCAPSRCSLMTGLHTGHCFTRGNVGFQGYDYPIPAETYTAGNLFKENGYRTACIGKWGLGGPDTSGHPLKHGFDRFYGYLSQHNAHFYYPNFLWDNENKVELNAKAYSHSLIQSRALDFINESDERPFFLYLTYTIPHAELAATDEYMEQFEGKYPQGHAHICKAPGRGYGTQEKPRQAFAAMMKQLDDSVGEVLEALKANGIDDNTLVFFSSDNGPHAEGGADPEFFDSNGPLTGIKRDLYDGGIRVPFIARWQGKIDSGRVTGHISAFWDILPTCAEILGAKLPGRTDGISLLPTLTGKGKQEEHEFLYWEFHEQGGKQALRMGKWKAVRLGVSKDARAPVMLFDITKDIAEQNDVAGKFPEVAARAARIMAEQHEKSDVYRLLPDEKKALPFS
jgi:arylsulfatase A-like enzyme